MSVKTPNSEQLDAIKHKGNAVLSAGAGSGKTYVLVEHIKYLIDDFFKKLLLEKKEINEKIIIEYFSKIVIMTFTNKAAAELKTRVLDRFSSLEDDYYVSKEVNKVVLKSINSIIITTIHGFCYSLISGGCIEGFSGSPRVISIAESREKIKFLFELWYEEQLEKKCDALNIILAHKELMIDSLTSVFLDPLVRQSWNSLDQKIDLIGEAEKTLKQVISLKGFMPLFSDSVDYFKHQDQKQKAWYKIVEGFIQVRELFNKDFERFVNELENVFKLGSFRKTKVLDSDPDLLNFFNLLKEFRSFYKKYFADFLSFYNNKREYSVWAKKIWELFNYIEVNYLNFSGVSFSDLEYVVYCSLINDSNTSKRVLKRFTYFIVDEFQDTSRMQFEIIKAIVKGDFSKVFFVGDVKQAIYGFRGGELDVFKESMKKVSNNLYLRNNYRSAKKVIEFNNVFFKQIINSGLEYTGNDQLSINYVEQVVPELEGNRNGVVSRIVMNLDKEKLSSEEAADIESILIVKKIEQLLNNSEENICVLFAKLTHSNKLIAKLVDRNISFRAQFKIPFNEDPILEIIKVILEGYLTYLRDLENFSRSEKFNSYVLFEIYQYFTALDINIPEEILSKNILKCYASIQMWGCFESVKKLLYQLGVSNSSFKYNFNYFEDLCKVNMDDVENVLLSIIQVGGKRNSMNYEFGATEKRVSIMTVHASKGLEFDNVILAGIHSNDTHVPDLGWFGILPLSFKWKVNQNSKNSFKSPSLILEGEVQKTKEFSETKRLLYVACTRAIKGLFYPEIILDGKQYFRGKNSWINAFRAFENKTCSEFEKYVVSKEYEHEDKNRKIISNRLPFFFRDNMGINQKIQVKNDLNEIKALYLSTGELSVTRLLSINQCFRKFYLMNICNIETPPVQVKNKEVKTDNVDSSDLRHISSTSRGSYLHDMISTGIKNGLIVPENLSDDDASIISWAFSEISKRFNCDQVDFISEKVFKFPFYNLMVSGIPDLVIRPFDIDAGIEIIDFKTGSRNNLNDNHYYLQLYFYAFGLTRLNFTQKVDKISLSLVYLDEKKYMTKIVSMEEIEKIVFEILAKIDDRDGINTSHCARCQYDSICND